MRIQDWIECGYTLEEAKDLMIKYAHENEYEDEAHARFAMAHLY